MRREALKCQRSYLFVTHRHVTPGEKHFVLIRSLTRLLILYQVAILSPLVRLNWALLHVYAMCWYSYHKMGDSTFKNADEGGSIFGSSLPDGLREVPETSLWIVYRTAGFLYPVTGRIHTKMVAIQHCAPGNIRYSKPLTEGLPHLLARTHILFIGQAEDR